MVALGGRAVSYERGTPVANQHGSLLKRDVMLMLPRSESRDLLLLPSKQRQHCSLHIQQDALPHPGGCAALRIVLVTVPRVSRSCENFSDGFVLRLLPIQVN